MHAPSTVAKGDTNNFWKKFSISPNKIHPQDATRVSRPHRGDGEAGIRTKTKDEDVNYKGKKVGYTSREYRY